jgi:hypothetical protein
MQSPDIPVDEVFNWLEEAGGYCYRLELGDHLVIHAALDTESNRQHGVLERRDGSARAEVFFEQGQGYGRRARSGPFRRVDGPPLPDHLRLLLEILKDTAEVETHVSDGLLRVDWEVTATPIQRDPAGFFTRLFADHEGPEARRLESALAERTAGVRIEASATFYLEDPWLRNVGIKVTLRDGVFEAFLSFEPGPVDLPGLPAAALEAPEETYPLALFLLDIPAWGWSATHNHGPWAQASLDLVEKTDTDGAYATLYDGVWSNGRFDYAAAKSGKGPIAGKHHPLIFGAIHEDTKDLPKIPYEDWFLSDDAYKLNQAHYAKQPYLRDYHHFGGEGTGLKDKWYFFFREFEDGATPDTTSAGDRFYSARDWGFGGGRIDAKLNRLTFCDAIEQFNQNSFDGRRRAYLMLGHVLHLLQDQGMPDHARLVDHAGSGKAEIDIFKYYCPILAAEIALLACAACSVFCPFCTIVGFAATEGICMGLVNPKEVGYEKLTADNLPSIPAAKVAHKPDYDSYFSGLATYSDTATTLKSALGCGSLTLPPLPTIPNINPDIDASDPKETKPYFDLTDKLLPEVIGYGAGMLRHFHDVVNPPPFVQRLAIVQWQAGDRPRGFAEFDKNNKDHCLRYNAEWRPSGGGRVLKITENQQISQDRNIYFFVQFGPTEVAPDTGRKMSVARLHVQGKNLSTGGTLNDEVILHRDFDPAVGHYYWGTYQPVNCMNDPNTFAISITGRDLGAHLMSRKVPGDVLDAAPSTVPYVDAATSPDFLLKNYQPGPDLHHKFTVGRLEWSGFVAVPQQVKVGRVAFVQLDVNQLRRDCAWELRPGPVTCPVTWKIETKLKWVELVRGRLRIRPDRSLTPPGTYPIVITCSLGVFSDTKTITATVL